MYGWHGKLLEVDLSSGKWEYIDLDEKILKKYIGGRGLGAYLFLKYTEDPNVDPLGEENPIILATGPLTATPSVTAGRMSATTRSPLSMTILDSNLGGYFGALMKTTGIDVMVVKGKASEPVYIYFDEDNVEILPANEIWGKGNFETTAYFKERYGKRASVLSIGQGGENLVRFASVMNDASRAFGRGGLGAVFGSKKLKAIVTIGGTKRPAIHSVDDFRDFRYEVNKLVNTHPVTSKMLKSLGTAGILNLMNSMGVLGTRNFRDNHFEHADDISGEALREKYLVRYEACWGCSIMCGRVSNMEGKHISGPEFETIYAFGSNLGVSNLAQIIKANYYANDYGLDTISTGGVLGYAMEMTEEGLHDFGIRFGEDEKLVEYIRKIAERKDIGDELAEGVKRLSEKYGGEDFAMHVKGMELPAYDPRGVQGMGLVYATSSRGACHLRGGYTVSIEIFGIPRRINRFLTVSKGTHVARHQDSGNVCDSLVVCRFTTNAISLHHWVRIYNAVTGQNLNESELERIGERIQNLERMINLKLGFTKKDDTLPRRLLKEAKRISDHGEFVVDLETMLKEYYEYRDWDENGVPRREKLKELDLEDDIPWL